MAGRPRTRARRALKNTGIRLPDYIHRVPRADHGWSAEFPSEYIARLRGIDQVPDLFREKLIPVGEVEGRWVETRGTGSLFGGVILKKWEAKYGRGGRTGSHGVMQGVGILQKDLDGYLDTCKLLGFQAKSNPAKGPYYLITKDGQWEILWAFMASERGGGSLTKKTVLAKDYSMYPSVWPNVVSVSSAEGALDRSIMLSDEARGMSRNAFEGGFSQRTGRLSGGTAQALGDLHNEAALYELLAYLLEATKSFGLHEPPLRLGRWGLKIEYVPKDRAERMQRRANKAKTARHW